MRASEVRGLDRTPRASGDNLTRLGSSLLSETFAPTGLLGESPANIGEQDHNASSCLTKVCNALVSRHD